MGNQNSGGDDDRISAETMDALIAVAGRGFCAGVSCFMRVGPGALPLSLNREFLAEVALGTVTPENLGEKIAQFIVREIDDETLEAFNAILSAGEARARGERPS